MLAPLHGQAAALRWSVLHSSLSQLESLHLMADFSSAGDPSALATLSGLTRLRLHGMATRGTAVWQQYMAAALLACTPSLRRLELVAVAWVPTLPSRQVFAWITDHLLPRWQRLEHLRMVGCARAQAVAQGAMARLQVLRCCAAGAPFRVLLQCPALPN